MPRMRVEKKIKRRRTLFTLSMLIIGIGTMIGVAIKSSYFSVKNIIVEKNNFVSVEEVTALAQIADENIFLLKKNQIEDRLLANPYINSANLKRKLPNTLVIELKEKEIKGLVKFQNSFINIDKEGRMVHIVNQFPDGKLPLLEGINVEQYVQGERLIKEDEIKEKALREVLTIPDYKECEGLFYSINLTDPYKIVLTTGQNVQINIGNYLNLDYKLGFALTLLSDNRIMGKSGFIELFNDGTAIFR